LIDLTPFSVDLRNFFVSKLLAFSIILLAGSYWLTG